MNISNVPLGISCLLFGCSAVFADDSNSSDGLAEVVVKATRLEIFMKPLKILALSGSDLKPVGR